MAIENKSLLSASLQAGEMLSSYTSPSTNIVLGGFSGNPGVLDYLGYHAGTPSFNFTSGDLKMSDLLGIASNLNSDYRIKRCQEFKDDEPTYDLSRTWYAIATEEYRFVGMGTASNGAGSQEVFINGSPIDPLGSGNVFQSASINIGDIITSNGPINIATEREDFGCVYMGWAGYTFATRRDRATTAAQTELKIVSVGDENDNTVVTNYKVLYQVNSGYRTTLTQQTAGTLTGRFDRADIALSTTRHYFIIADRPIACAVRYTDGTIDTDDSMPLYPMDRDDKYGEFSQGGHIFSTSANFTYRTYEGGGTYTSGVVNQRTDSNSYIEWTQASAAESVFIEIAPQGSGAGNFNGAASKLLGNGDEIFTAEQQADGDGTEATPFVGELALGLTTRIPSDAEWVKIIGNGPRTIAYYNANGVKQTSFTLAGDATFGIYDYYYNASVPSGSWFSESGSAIGVRGEFAIWYDTSKAGAVGNERVTIMSRNKIIPPGV